MTAPAAPNPHEHPIECSRSRETRHQPAIRRVRAIVLNYNRADLTLKCVDLLKRQAHSCLDIVVVDNASRRKDIDQLSQHLPSDVLLLRSSENRGYAAGNNIGLRTEKLAKPDYFLIINNDAVPQDPSLVLGLEQVLEDHPAVGAVSPLVDNHPSGTCDPRAPRL